VQKAATILSKRLENARKVGILAVGSELRADDVAGILVAQRIKELTKKNSPECRGGSRTAQALKGRDNANCLDVPRRKFPAKLKIFIGATAPENLTGEIKKFKPDHLIIIDAADLNAKPGTIKVMDVEEIAGTTFCTHSLPIKVMADYLLESFKFNLIAIGIQPKTLAVGAQPSKEVLTAVDLLAEMLVNLSL
jgi:hydrogenase 3 maturation protease